MVTLKNGMMFKYAHRKYFVCYIYIVNILIIFLYCFIYFYRSIVIPGLSLMGRGVLGTFYMIGLAYFFFGIAIISDIFMEAIEAITAQTKAIELWDKERKSVSIN